MRLTSPAFENQGKIPAKYTCTGENVNPPLLFRDIPENAKSFVLLVDDPDAPGGMWVHWVVFNMTAVISSIAENTKPEGTIGMTSFGKNEYGGPCPPPASPE